MHAPDVLIDAGRLLGAVLAVRAAEARFLVALVARVTVQTRVDAEGTTASVAAELLAVVGGLRLVLSGCWRR